MNDESSEGASRNIYEPPRADVTTSAPGNPHSLPLQLIGVFISTAVIAYAAAPGIAIVGLLVFADAWRSGIYKDKTRRSFLNISPMSWCIVVQMLFPIGFPLYVIFRHRLQTRDGGDGYYSAAVIVGGLVIVITVWAVYMAMQGGT